MYLVHGVDVTGVRPKTVVHRGERDARPETQRSLTVLGVHEHVHDYMYTCITNNHAGFPALRTAGTSTE